MKVLVAGGAGFLGSHLCEVLLARGDSVVCLDNFSTGRFENLASISDYRRFGLIDGDVDNASSLWRQPFDAIYNLACPASPRQYQRHPVATLRTSFRGSDALLELARESNAKILLASTSEIYGEPLSHPQREQDWGNVNPIGPRSCYDEGKRAAEALFFAYARQYGVRIKIARLFNAYGPRLAAGDGRVVSNFIVQALEGKPLTVYGDGTQTRSFCYVGDTVRGLVALMNSDESVRGPVNIGRPTETAIGDLARAVIEITKSSSPIVFRPLPQDDPSRRCPDISLARELLGWEPRVTLSDGLCRTVDYFETQTRELFDA